jgi:hypothetical protein
MAQGLHRVFGTIQAKSLSLILKQNLWKNLWERACSR